MFTPKKLQVGEADQGVAADRRLLRAFPKDDFHRARLDSGAAEQMVRQGYFHASFLLISVKVTCSVKRSAVESSPEQSIPSFTSHTAVQFDANFL